MSKVSSKSVNIFLALDKKALAGYFNPHDTAPIYKRQLSLRFEQYLRQSTKYCKRFDPIFFKLNSNNKVDEQFADPIMYAIRRHFTEKRDQEILAFRRFKRRNYGTIIVSMAIVALLNYLLPYMIPKESAKDLGVAHFVDVFSFVIFYHPLTELLFNWNPYLKRINLLNKLIKAEAIMVGSAEKGEDLIGNFDSFEEEMEEEELTFRL
jgi:hypothetical protein